MKISDRPLNEKGTTFRQRFLRLVELGAPTAILCGAFKNMARSEGKTREATKLLRSVGVERSTDLPIDVDREAVIRVILSTTEGERS